jgi:hypothetical protein
LPHWPECRIHVVDLATGHEGAVDVPRDPDASDTLPAMWRGRIAFMRRDSRHHGVGQVMLWSPADRRLETLPHGTVPSCPAHLSCAGATTAAGVEALDLSSSVVSFVWRIVGPGVSGMVGFEVRAVRVADHHKLLLWSGAAGEACTHNGHPDARFPFSPIAEGRRVWYGVQTSRCDVYTPELLTSTTSKHPAQARGPLPSGVLRIAKDGSSLYALVSPVAPARPWSCVNPQSPCTIEPIDQPTLIQLVRRPGTSPFTRRLTGV